jgi:hypothetical protein
MVRRYLLRIALVLAVVGVNLVAAAAPSSAAQTATPPASRTQKRLAKQTVLKKGLKWIESKQDASGGFPDATGYVDGGTTGVTISTLIALQNAGLDVETDTSVDFLQEALPRVLGETPEAGEDVVLIGQIVMALVAAGADPRDVGGHDLVALLVDSWDAEAGIYGDLFGESALTVMALAAADEPIEEEAITTFAAKQLDDGSWSSYGDTEPGSGTVEGTAYVVQALVAAGRGDDPMIADALAFFRSIQDDEGGFPVIPGEPPDAYSTGNIISALIAAGEDPKEWGDAVSALLAFQNESGAFRPRDDMPFDDIGATLIALTALAGAYWPVQPTA